MFVLVLGLRVEVSVTMEDDLMSKVFLLVPGLRLLGSVCAWCSVSWMFPDSFRFLVAPVMGVKPLRVFPVS